MIISLTLLVLEQVKKFIQWPAQLEAKKETKIPKKYFDVARYNCICRPQYKYACGVASLTAVFNFLYSTKGSGSLKPVTHEEVMQILGFKEPYAEIRFGPFTGNQAIMKWFKTLVAHFGLTGSARILWKEHGAGKTNVDPDTAESFIIQNLHNPNVAFIYHCYNHYCVPVGYDITCDDPSQTFNEEISKESTGWLFCGDSSKTNKPILCAKWSDVKLDLAQKSPYYLNIRHIEDGIQKRNSTKKPGDNLHCFMIFEKNKNETAMNTVAQIVYKPKKKREVPVEIYVTSK